MVTEQQVRKVALFFFFTFLDEKTAFEAAHRAVSYLKTQQPSRKRGDGAALSDFTVITVLKKTYEQFKKSASRSQADREFDLVVDVPKSVDLVGWRNFLKSSADSETIAVVLAKILNYDEEDVARGLNVSLGTARYRIGKGIRNLGETLKRT